MYIFHNSLFLWDPAEQQQQLRKASARAAVGDDPWDAGSQILVSVCSDQSNSEFGLGMLRSTRAPWKGTINFFLFS